MHKLVVLYPHPDEPQWFRDHYHEHHLPLAAKLPGLVSWEVGFPTLLGPGSSAHFCIFQATFKSEKALFDALGSAEGRAVADDVTNYSPKGATLMYYETREA